MSCTLTDQQKRQQKPNRNPPSKNRLFLRHVAAVAQYLLIRQLRKLSLTVFATPVIFLLSAELFASEYECHSGQQTRHIRIDYPGYDHLCEVSVTRPGQPREVKWYANSDSTFCSKKIIELVGKHQNQWGFSCEQQPDHGGINKLNLRQRKFLDNLVRQNRTIDNNDTEFILLGTRALIEPSTTTNNSSVADLLAIQLFMARLGSTEPQASAATGTGATISNNQNDTQDNTTTLANRVILYADDGEKYDTLATLDNLNNVIEIEEQGYYLDSVLIDTLHPNGDLDVSTLIAAPDDDPNALPSCYGTQRFQRTAAGLLAVAQHQFTCK